MKRESLRSYSLIIIALTLFLCLSGFINNRNDDKNDWKLVWQEDFNDGRLDTLTWGYMDRRGDQSRKYHSSYNGCYDFNDCCIVIKGIKNNKFKSDTASYLTGAISTKGKMKFTPPCKIEVRAKINSAGGAWPAIWFLPFEIEKGWPADGEIDLMEHSNFDDYFTQTVHSSYTKANPSSSPKRFTKVNFDGRNFNTYGVEIMPDEVIFHFNGKETMRYPKIDSLQAEGQFPFNRDWYLMIDMQLGAPFVGAVQDRDLPIDMEIDWVKYYVKGSP